MCTIRVTSNPDSARRNLDTTDVDVPGVFEGLPIEDAGRRVYDELIDVASGKMTTGEILRLDDAFGVNRIGPSV